MIINKKSRAGCLHSLLTRTTATSLFLSLALVGAGASAQVSPPPSSAQPSHMDQRFQPQIEPQEDQQAAPSIEVPQTQIGNKLAQRFTLRTVQIEDATVYAPGTFDSLFRGKLNRPMTLSQARDIARAITTKYRTDGYALSQAVIPNQDLTRGVLRIRVVEGFIDKIYIENDRPQNDKRNLIAGYASKIRSQRPLNTKTLERYLLLMDDLPGMQARAIIHPSPTTFGAADLILQVHNKTVDASFTSDNRGNKFVGPYQEQLTLAENSAIGLGERTTVRGINTIPTADLHYFDLQHEEQLNSEGTKLIALVGFARTRPGDILSPLDYLGKSNDYALTVSHPFIRSRAQNLTGRVTFDARDTTNDAIGIQLNNDKVRSLRAGGTYDTSDSFDGIDQADAAVSKGVSWLGATSNGAGRSRAVADQEYTKINLDLSRLQNLPSGFSLLTSATGQYTSDALLTSEQFILGGVAFGGAYDNGEVSGDKGIAGKVELRWGQQVGERWFDSYQLYGYYDIGKAITNDAAPGTDDGFSLASVGTGVRANFNQNLSGYLEVGFPLTRSIASENNKDPRLFFSLTGRY